MKVANTKGITISWASLVDIDTDEEILLTEKLEGRGKPSRCHFFEPFRYGEYIIELRLDWENFESMNPSLDADIWKGEKTKKNRLPKGKYHETKPVWDDRIKKKVYDFQFEGFRSRFALKMQIERNILADFDVIKKSDGKEISRQRASYPSNELSNQQ